MVNSGSLRSFRDHETLSQISSPDTHEGSPSSLSPPSMVQTSPTVVASPITGRAVDETMSASPNDRPAPHPPPTLDEEAYDLSHFFVVDSFNIHRLVIAGVTCASKFFSDVFYTNSRYAKV